MSEFEGDNKRTKYLKRLFRNYKTSGVLRERLILNHLIIFTNVFGIEAASRLLFSRIEEDLHIYLKTFLIYLNSLPESIPEADLITVALDRRIIAKLREIK
jgi:hypothetical protein